MADIENIISRYNQEISNIGRAGLHALFPRDIEFYSMALELVDIAGNSIDYFVFPIMPSQIRKSEANRNTVKKTAKATVILGSKYFTPSQITMTGNFGRTFKILIGKQPIVFKGLRFSRKSGVNKASDLETSGLAKIKAVIPEFNVNIKTGYGCIKILQSMIDKARGTDADGNPFKLYLYNQALGESYWVVPNKQPLILSQDENQQNMIWNYSLDMIIVSEDISGEIGESSLLNLLGRPVIQRIVNQVGRDVFNFVSKKNISDVIPKKLSTAIKSSKK
jgi:hypothetical protein